MHVGRLGHTRGAADERVRRDVRVRTAATVSVAEQAARVDARKVDGTCIRVGARKELLPAACVVAIPRLALGGTVAVAAVDGLVVLIADTDTDELNATLLEAACSLESEVRRAVEACARIPLKREPVAHDDHRLATVRLLPVWEEHLLGAKQACERAQSTQRRCTRVSTAARAKAGCTAGAGRDALPLNGRVLVRRCGKLQGHNAPCHIGEKFHPEHGNSSVPLGELTQKRLFWKLGLSVSAYMAVGALVRILTMLAPPLVSPWVPSAKG
jgi:hypothetical protein